MTAQEQAALVSSLKSYFGKLNDFQKFFFPGALKKAFRDPKTTNTEIINAAQKSTWFFHKWFFSGLRTFLASPGLNSKVNVAPTPAVAIQPANVTNTSPVSPIPVQASSIPQQNRTSVSPNGLPPAHSVPPLASTSSMPQQNTFSSSSTRLPPASRQYQSVPPLAPTSSMSQQNTISGSSIQVLRPAATPSYALPPAPFQPSVTPVIAPLTRSNMPLTLERIGDNQHFEYTGNLTITGGIGRNATVIVKNGSLIVQGGVGELSNVRLGNMSNQSIVTGRVIINGVSMGGDAHTVKIIGDVGEHAKINAPCADIDIQGNILRCAEIKTQSGNVAARNIATLATLHSMSGDIRVGDVALSARLKSMSGNIHAQDVSAGASLNTMSGDVRVRNDLGASLNTMSGDIFVNGERRIPAAHAVSRGDVSIPGISIVARGSSVIINGREINDLVRMNQYNDEPIVIRGPRPASVGLFAGAPVAAAVPTNNQRLLDIHFDMGRIPEEFCCIIMATVMTDPVYVEGIEQYVFDRSSILRHLERSETHPYTRQPITAADLLPQRDLQARINAFVDQAVNQSPAAPGL